MKCDLYLALYLNIQVQLCKFFSVKLFLFFFLVLTCVLGAQKNLLNETVLLSTNNICFG